MTQEMMNDAVDGVLGGDEEEDEEDAVVAQVRGVAGWGGGCSRVRKGRNGGRSRRG
jgi:hypothetical protein